ncbi:site-specific integrase [Halorussus sp. MSC15.2]|uniref:tyrosine-type recombinase/integrase n=1 Tax=Halorussus sp. MSC15.2 TaxID=2283638 RepID=UPI0013D2A5E6|nr:tyrosine-type recombinase/integrase [Halorussus sp. MSC15.2]NEU56734.1 tyrosine-type recombinase/integrase [Halorussus sp. MSC15.2]
MSENLEPLPPAEAVNLYLDHREPELSEKSIENQRYRLNSFIDFCQEEEIENLNSLTGRDLHRYRVWRRNGEGDGYGDDGVSKTTLRSNLATLRVFLEFAAGIDAVEQGMRERVLLPELDPEEEAKEEQLPEDRAERILDHLNRFHYASRDHVIIALLWHTGIRLGSLRAFDVGDFDSKAPCLELRHRPEEGTPLKNGKAAKRTIAVGEHYAEVLQDYLAHNRHDVTDEYGREPLLTSAQGRLTATPIRRTVYEWTLPCVVADCPHGEDPATCRYKTDRDHASGCPSSRSPHGIRRGAITKHLRDGTPEEIVTDRMNVSGDVLDQHYDQRTEREKMELRREFIQDA